MEFQFSITANSTFCIVPALNFSSCERPKRDKIRPFRLTNTYKQAIIFYDLKFELVHQDVQKRFSKKSKL